MLCDCRLGLRTPVADKSRLQAIVVFGAPPHPVWRRLGVRQVHPITAQHVLADLINLALPLGRNDRKAGGVNIEKVETKGALQEPMPDTNTIGCRPF